jgi:2-keto-4-pentenoate hydratase
MTSTRTQEETSVERFADELAEAERTGVPVAPLTEREPSFSVADAYAVQLRNISRRQAAGGRILGRKIGLTSRAMQRLLGVDEPDFGVLLDDMVVEDGDAIRSSELIAPRIEAEIAFVMERDLAGPGVDGVAALRAVAGAVPAIEIIDSRIADWQIKLPDTIADNASSARYMLGARLTPTDRLDLRLCGVVVTRNGVLADTGAGAAVLGNPIRCVAWLANKLGEFGDGLHAGDVVLAGAVHAAVPVEPGDVVRAEFAHLGSVTARFADNEGASA